MWDNLKQFWIKLPANRKRQIVIATVCLILFVILWNFLFGSTYEPRENTEPSTISLTGADTDRFGMDSMERRLSEMEKRMQENEQEQQQKRETLKEELQTMESSYQERIQELQAKIEKERKAREQAQNQAQEAAEEDPDKSLDEAVELVAGQEDSADQDSEGSRQPVDEQRIWEDESRYQSGNRFSAQQEGRGSQDNGPPSPEIRPGDGSGEQNDSGPKTASMTVIESESQDEGKQSQGSSGDKEASQYIPAGSIISGTLITGLDAPTSQQARGEPHPALLRISKDTILPNRYRADMRECFIIISGYGDMSSERAYMRSEALSCINEDGEAMEVGLKSFAIGEDGKAGLRGRLVSREGQMIAQSVMAGGLSAMSEVFSSSPVPTIATGDAASSQPFQQALSSESAQAGALTGAGDAMERIADYYLDMADQIFPILEIDAGRRVDLVVNQGTQIQFGGD